MPVHHGEAVPAQHGTSRLSSVLRRVGAAWLRDRFSAGKSATNLGNICCETIYERLASIPAVL